MIGKGKSIGHGAQAIDYALNKDNAEVLDKQGVCGISGAEIKQEFEVFQQLNTRAENKDLSFVLSPEPKDGKKLTNTEFRNLARDFMEKMDLSKHQYITIKHTDREHTHLHIIANRISPQGKAYKDNFIGKKCQRVAEQIAHKKGLTLAKNVEMSRKIETKELRAEIKQIHDEVMKQRPIDFRDYMERMKANKVEVKPTINKAGKVQGFRLERYGKSFKASQVHRSINLAKMLAVSNPTALALNTAKIVLKPLIQQMNTRELSL